MSRKWDGVLEWIRPGRLPRPSVPPLEGGLRPNGRLDAGAVLAIGERFQFDDITRHRGQLVATSGERLVVVDAEGNLPTLATLPGRCSAIISDGERLIVAVDGHGLVTVDDAGEQTPMTGDAVVREGVADLCMQADGSLLAAVSSARWPLDRWSDALLERDRSGQVVRVVGERTETLVGGLAWPAGVAPADDGFAVSESLASQVSVISSTGRRTPLLSNLPVYPGRLRASPNGGWWIVAPYPRNRLTELLLTEPAVIAEMRETIEPQLWLVPRLGSRQVIREPLQHGQRRVLGQIRPWAPAWSYGLAFHVDERGQITESLHSRTDGSAHGVTGVCPGQRGSIVLAVQGAGKVVEAEVRA